MSKEIFEFNNYIKYLLFRLGNTGIRSGKRKDLSRFLSCQSSFLSQVLSLKTKVNFSLEQGILVNKYFHHTQEEGHYFMLLLELERSGTAELKAYFQSQIDELILERNKLKTRMKNYKEINQDVQGVFYSSWKYQAIQSLLSIPKLQSSSSISEYLSLPESEVVEILNFLITHQLALKTENGYKIGSQLLHLNEHSKFLKQHHINWKMRGIDSLDYQNRMTDFHYSAVITLENNDIIKLRKKIIDQLGENLKFVESSEAQSGHVLCIDLFGLKK